MTKFLFTSPNGGPMDYPALGFSAVDGAILNGASSDPAITTVPDGNWAIYGGGSAETGINRYAPPATTPTYTEPTNGHILTWSDSDNSGEWVAPVDAFTPVADSLVEALIEDTGSDTSVALTAAIGTVGATQFVGSTVIAGAGIDATGATDSTTAVNAKLAAAVALGIPAVYWPVGTYKGNFVVPPPAQRVGLKITGDGVGHTVLKPNGSTPVVTIGDGGVLDAQHISMTDLTIDANTVATACVRLNHTRFFKLYDADVKGATTYGVEILGSVANYFAHFLRVRFATSPINIYNSGAGGLGGNSCYFEKCHFSGSTNVNYNGGGNACAVVLDGPDSCIFEGNEFVAAGDAIYSHNSAAYNKIRDNQFDGPTMAIRMASGGVRDWFVRGNTGTVAIYDGGLDNQIEQPNATVTGTSTTTRVIRPPKVEVFAASGTWTKALGARTVVVQAIGAGGGGGSGRRGAAASVRCGGGGGGGAGITEFTLAASALGATETVTVGTAGTAGAAQTVDGSNGSAGGAGGNSSFGSLIVAGGGGAGAAGTNSTGTAGTAGSGRWNGGSGGAANTSGGVGNNAQAGVGATPGGGSGGGITTADAASAGGPGAFAPGRGSATAAGGTSGGGAGGAGSSTVASQPQPGSGGGGGGSSITGAAGAGGVGGDYGAGGGGGGASLNGNNSGAGGAGGAGLVVVTTYFS